MSDATRTLKRWRIDIRTKLDVDTIKGAAREVEPSDLATGDTYGLLLHEVHIRGGRTQIVASTSAAGAKVAAQRLKALSGGAKVKVTAARIAKRK